jgi:class 3 adenylate cyclase
MVQTAMALQLFASVAKDDLPRMMSLIQEGADVHARDYNDSTPLHVAAAMNLLSIARHLIDAGAYIESKDACGRTPLDIAMQRKNQPIITALTRAGAQPQQPSRCVSSVSIRRCSTAKNVILAHFPASVAAAIMQGQAVPPVCKRDVSIFFSNIVDYTSLRGAMDPIRLCGMLERLFSKLDRLAEAHGVQRVDAIDGCYMAAANFSADQASDHAVRLARFALDAVAAAGATALDEERPELGAVRVLAGMHCGEVCGSVVGAHGGRKHTLHGDAVNVASRMQSHGAAGAVQCSAAAAARIEAQGGCGGGGLRLGPRDGGVDVKGRGHMAAFWLGGARLPAGPACGRRCAETAAGLVAEQIRG